MAGSGSLKGITIQIGGDVTDLKKSFDDLTSQSKSLSRELSQAEKALALDPSNVELLEQKERLAAQQAEVLKSKIELVNTALSDQGVKSSTQAYDYLQRELAYAKNSFNELGNAVTEVDLSQVWDGAGLSIGEDLVDLAKDLASSVFEYAEAWDTAGARISAAVGDDVEAGERLTEVGRELYSEGWGESLESLTDAAISAREVLGDLGDEDMSTVVKTVETLETTFGSDMTESLRGVNVLMEKFGLTATEACDLMVAGTQRGLDYTDELGDNLSEYAGRWADAGMSATEYFSLLQAGVDAGAYNLDKVGDYLNEFLTSLSDGRMESNITSFSAATQAVWESYKSGGATAQDMLNAVVGELRDCESQTEALTIASDTWSSLGEDNAFSVITALAGVQDSYTDTAGAASDAAEALEESVAQRMESLKRQLLEVVEPIASAALGALSGALDALEPVIDGFNDLSDAQKAAALGGTAIAAALPKVTTALKALKTAATAAKTAQVGLNAAMKAGVAALAVTALTSIIGNYENMREKAEELAKAQENLQNASGGIEKALGAIDSSALSGVASAADGAASSMDSAAGSAAALRTQMEASYSASLESVSAAASQFAESAERIASVDASNTQLQGYVDTIQELANKGNLTEAEMAELETAVRRYNEVTGEGVTIVDRQNGTLSENASAINDVAQAYMASAKAQAYQNELTDLYQQQIEQMQDLEEATHDWAEAQVAAWEEVYGDGLAESLGVTRDQLVELTATDGEMMAGVMQGLAVSADSYTASLHQGNAATEDTIAALGLAEATMTNYQAALDGTNSSISYLEGELNGLGDAAQDAADGTGGAAESIESAVIGARGAAEDVGALAGALEDAGDASADAGDAIEDAFARVNEEGGDLADLTDEVNQALKDAGVSTDGLTEAQVALAYQTGMTGDELVEMVKQIEDAKEAEDEAQKAAEEAQEQLESDIETMRELCDETPGLQAAIESSGTTLEQLAVQLEETGYGLDEFKSDWNDLSDAQNPFDAYAYDWETFSSQNLLDGLNTNTQVVRDWAEGIQELWANANTEADRQFVQYLQDMGVDSATLMQNWIDGVGPSYEECRDAYMQNQATLNDAIVGNAEAAMQAGQEVGESIPEGVSEGIEQGASGVTDSASIIGEEAYAALSTMPEEFEARGIVAGNSLAEGFAQADMAGAVLSLNESLAQAVSGTSDAMRAVGGNAAAAFGEGLASTEAAEAAGTSLASALAQALSGTDGAMQTVGGNAAAAFADGIASRESLAGTSASLLSQSVAAALANFATDMTTVGSNGGVGFAAGVMSETGAASSSASALSTAAGSALSSFAANMGIVGSNGGAAFAAGIGSGSFATSNAASLLSSSAASALSSAASWAYSSGASLAHNFANGISSGYSAVSGAASALASAASAYLHHSTPEKGPLHGDDMWGAELAQNFAVGMESGERGVRNAALALAGAASFSASPAWSGGKGAAGGTTYNVYINDAQVNDSAAMQECVLDLLQVLSNEGRM